MILKAEKAIKKDDVKNMNHTSNPIVTIFYMFKIKKKIKSQWVKMSNGEIFFTINT